MPQQTPVTRARKLWFAAAVGVVALGAAAPAAWASTSASHPAAAGAQSAPSASPSHSAAAVSRLSSPPAAAAPSANPSRPAEEETPSAATASAPRASAPRASRPSGTYVVAAGDTLGLIAQQSGVGLDTILAANGLDPSSVIYPGEAIRLDGSGVPAKAPVAQPPAPQAAQPAVQAAPAAVPAAPAAQMVYVAGSGGQAMVDKCIGPIHFTSLDSYALFIVEHDFCGGWAQFSGLQVGQKVTIVGYGTYTVTARGEAPQGGTTSDVLAAFGHYSKAYLQTCIPGTSQMLLIALD